MTKVIDVNNWGISPCYAKKGISKFELVITQFMVISTYMQNFFLDPVIFSNYLSNVNGQTKKQVVYRKKVKWFDRFFCRKKTS